MEKIYGMHKLVGLQLFWSRTPTFSSGTPTFCQMGVLNSCFQNPSESSVMSMFYQKELYEPWILLQVSSKSVEKWASYGHSKNSIWPTFSRHFEYLISFLEFFQLLNF